jgi:antitoxin VapB
MKVYPMTKTAALFTNGGSQAVRLPADCRFDGDRVFVRRDARTGDVILSSRPPSAWGEFMKLRAEMGSLTETEDFLADRPLNAPGGLRDPFGGTDA